MNPKPGNTISCFFSKSNLFSTKEVGIVSNIRKNKGARPVVKIYYNRVNRPITEDKIVDLGMERTVFIEEIL